MHIQLVPTPRRAHGRRPSVLFIAVVGLLVSTGCASYVTPGRAVALDHLAEGDIQERLSRQPAASFPARVATVRVQAPGYRSHSGETYGGGRFCVLTTREFERDDDFARLQKLPQLAAVAPVNRLLLPRELNSDRDLRLGAASLKADMLFVYTVDTGFWIDNSALAPLSTFHLGLLPDRAAKVVSTCSAVLFDVRTGYVYGAFEATEQQEQIASAWTSHDAVDQTRRKAEAEAFHKLVGEFEKSWPQLVAEYSRAAHATPRP